VNGKLLFTQLSHRGAMIMIKTLFHHEDHEGHEEKKRNNKELNANKLNVFFVIFVAFVVNNYYGLI
jgi:hypothetical protein